MNHKHLIPASLFLAAGIVIAGLFMSNALVKARKLDRSVIVKGLAEREVMADLAIWPIKTTIGSNDLMEIEKNLERNIRIINQYLIDSGFGKEEISRGIPAIYDSHANRYAQPQQLAAGNRYFGSITLTVRTDDMNKLDDAITGISNLIGKGVVLDQENYWQQVEYLYTSLNDIKPEMIEEATKNARLAAEKFAVDSDSKVGKIKTASQGLFSITNRDMNSPQIKKVRVVSTIEFYIED